MDSQIPVLTNAAGVTLYTGLFSFFHMLSYTKSCVNGLGHTVQNKGYF